MSETSDGSFATDRVSARRDDPSATRTSEHPAATTTNEVVVTYSTSEMFVISDDD